MKLSEWTKNRTGNESQEMERRRTREREDKKGRKEEEELRRKGRIDEGKNVTILMRPFLPFIDLSFFLFWFSDKFAVKKGEEEG